jgi:3-oxoacyl-[acyl-carrier-protein] synthase III
MAPIARIAGVGMTPLFQGPGPPQRTAVGLMIQALHAALRDAELSLSDIDGVVALPSIMADQHFMMAHQFATEVGQRMHGTGGCSSSSGGSSSPHWGAAAAEPAPAELDGVQIR